MQSAWLAGIILGSCIMLQPSVLSSCEAACATQLSLARAETPGETAGTLEQLCLVLATVMRGAGPYLVLLILQASQINVSKPTHGAVCAEGW